MLFIIRKILTFVAGSLQFNINRPALAPKRDRNLLLRAPKVVTTSFRGIVGHVLTPTIDAPSAPTLATTPERS